MRAVAVLLSATLFAACLIEVPASPEWVRPFQMEVLPFKREILPLEPLFLRIRLCNMTTSPLHILSLGDEFEITATDSEGKTFLFNYAPFNYRLLKPCQSVLTEPHLYFSDEMVLELIPFPEDGEQDPTRPTRLTLTVIFETEWRGPHSNKEQQELVVKTVPVLIKPLKNRRLLDAYRLIKAFVCDELEKIDEEIFRRYGIPIPYSYRPTCRQSLVYMKLLRDIFADTPYGACAGFFYADWLGHAILYGTFKSDETDYLPTLEEVLTAYRWVVERFPDSCWAYFAHKRTAYLEKFYGGWADRVLSDK